MISTITTIAENMNLSATNKFRNETVQIYEEMLESLNTIDESIISKNIEMIPVYKINNEGYAIDLDSLKYTVESEQCTLEEAVQKIKDINYIEDYCKMYCVLKEGYNKRMALENFITLSESLSSANIDLVVTEEVGVTDFVNEGFDLTQKK